MICPPSSSQVTGRGGEYCNNEPFAEPTAWSGRGMARPVCIPTASAPRHSGRAFGMMLTRISILLCIAAAVALFFASDLVILHILPRSFQLTGTFAFWCGAIVSIIAVILAIVSLTRNGKSRSGVLAFACSVAEFLAFGLVYLYAIFSA